MAQNVPVVAVASPPSHTTPLCRCRVLYIGSQVPTITKDGLQGIQEPLKDLYPTDSPADRKGKDSWLSVWSNGLVLEELDSEASADSVFFPITSLHYCAAVRYVNVTGYAVEGGGEKFLPIDSPFANLPDSQHPAIFAAMLRRTKGVRVLECHAFICSNPKAANALVRCCFHAYADSMYLKNEDLSPMGMPPNGPLLAIKAKPTSSGDSSGAGSQAGDTAAFDLEDGPDEKEVLRWSEAKARQNWQRRQQSGEYDSASISSSLAERYADRRSRSRHANPPRASSDAGYGREMVLYQPQPYPGTWRRGAMSDYGDNVSVISVGPPPDRMYGAFPPPHRGPHPMHPPTIMVPPHHGSPGMPPPGPPPPHARMPPPHMMHGPPHPAMIPINGEIGHDFGPPPHKPPKKSKSKSLSKASKHRREHLPPVPEMSGYYGPPPPMDYGPPHHPMMPPPHMMHGPPHVHPHPGLFMGPGPHRASMSPPPMMVPPSPDPVYSNPKRRAVEEPVYLPGAMPPPPPHMIPPMASYHPSAFPQDRYDSYYDAYLRPEPTRHHRSKPHDSRQGTIGSRRSTAGHDTPDGPPRNGDPSGIYRKPYINEKAFGTTLTRNDGRAPQNEASAGPSTPLPPSGNRDYRYTNGGSQSQAGAAHRRDGERIHEEIEVLTIEEVRNRDRRDLRGKEIASSAGMY